jgi:hypothetical protein
MQERWMGLPLSEPSFPPAKPGPGVGLSHLRVACIVNHVQYVGTKYLLSPIFGQNLPKTGKNIYEPPLVENREIAPVCNPD